MRQAKMAGDVVEPHLPILCNPPKRNVIQLPIRNAGLGVVCHNGQPQERGCWIPYLSFLIVQLSLAPSAWSILRLVKLLDKSPRI